MASFPSEISWRPAASAVAAAGVAIAAAAGCGGLEPGDYVVYRVVLSAPKLGGGCLEDDNVKSDSTTFRTSGTFVLHAGPEGAFYLDTGLVTLAGAEEGDGYKFSGESVDVEFFGMANQDKMTTTIATTVEMTLDGDAVSGKISTSTSVEYACADPTQCEDAACSQTLQFIGAEANGVPIEAAEQTSD